MQSCLFMSRDSQKELFLSVYILTDFNHIDFLGKVIVIVDLSSKMRKIDHVIPELWWYKSGISYGRLKMIDLNEFFSLNILV